MRGRKNPFLAQDLSKKAKGAKYKNVNPIQILQMAAAEGEYARFAVPQAVGLRKEWFDFVVGEDRSIDIMTAKQYGIAIKLMGDKETKEGSDFRKKLMKKRPDIVMEYETADMTAEKRLEAWRKEFAKPDLTPSDVGKLPLAAWNNPAFQEALGNHIQKLQNEDEYLKMTAEERKDAGFTEKKKYFGAGSSYKTTVRNNIKGTSSKNMDKLRILKNVASHISAFSPEKIRDEARRGEKEKKEEGGEEGEKKE